MSGDEVKISFADEKKKDKDNMLTPVIIVLLLLSGAMVLYNAFEINSINGLMTGLSSHSSGSRAIELASIDVDSITSTAQTIAAVFPLNKIKTQEDAMAYMFPTGTPEYGAGMGVSFDDPINSLALTASMYNSLKSEVQQKDPEAWQRFINLATKPVGISCEFCCGVGPVGIDGNGNLRCGCQHNPALQTIALYLTAYTNYNDGEILREVMKWKTLFFPRDMINLGLKVAGGDSSVLADQLPGMVGGC